MPHSLIIEISEVENLENYKIFTYGVVLKKDDFGNLEIIWKDKRARVYLNKENLDEIKEGDLVYLRGNIRKRDDKLVIFADFVKKSKIKNKEVVKKILELFKNLRV